MNGDAKKQSAAAKFFKSFRYAFAGLIYLVRTEQNMQVHVIIAGLVVIAGILLGISRAEWMLVVLASGLVFVAETVNTALEKLVDILSPGFQEKAGRAKDLAAGAVLVSAVVAVIIGLLVFIPHLLAVFG